MCFLGNKYTITQTDINAIKTLHQIINKIMDYLIKQKLIKRNEVDKIVNQIFRLRGLGFSKFQSNQFAYLRLRADPEYTKSRFKYNSSGKSVKTREC